MAYEAQKDKRRFIEFNNLFVDYTDGDVVIIDNANDLTKLYPLKAMINMVALCTKGKQQIKAGNEVIEITEGDIVVLPPDCIITPHETDDTFVCKALCLSDHIVQGLLRDRISVWQHTMHKPVPTVVKLTETMLTESGYYFTLISSKLNTSDSQPPYEIIQALLRALLLEICFLLEGSHGNIADQKMSQGKLLFNKFLSLISNNKVKRRPIIHYASQLAITPKYLTMLCLKYSDKTASDWVIQYTTEDIRFYLRNSNLSIKEISAKLGFANMSHFGSYVRKHLGASPSEYRDHKKE
jgi:AraC-like DNA-binding protein